MRLTDADVANKRMKRNNAFINSYILKEILAIDPLDALGICRCKDCIHSGIWEEDNIFSHCYYWGYEEGTSPNVVKLNDFCSNAVRRKENNNA